MARGASGKKEWNVSGPLRALLWWPGVAFVLVLVDPDNIAWTIATAGVVLVALGFLLPIVARSLRPAVAAAAVRVNQAAPTMEIDMGGAATMEIPPVDRAA